jgi:dTDP-D-glucose 4,6-dehydratase
LYDENYEDIYEHIDFSIGRPGQDVRYALDDSKLKSLGWKTSKDFETEIVEIVNFYRNKFIW